jgi:hypothetical protein
MKMMNNRIFPNIENCIKDNIVNDIDVGDIVILNKSNNNTSNKAVMFKPSNKICIPNPKFAGLIPLEDYHSNGRNKYDSDFDILLVIKK